MADAPQSGQQNGRQMRFTEGELSLIRSTFKGNTDLLKLMRKVFLPELDPKAPFGQMIDLWMTVPLKQLSPEQAAIQLIARNELINHLDQMLMQLQALAEMKEETPEEATERRKKDSSK